MVLSFLSGLVTGCFIGIAGQYYGQKFIGNIKQSEQQKNKKIDWDKMSQEYPIFMNHIKSDINDPEYKTIREFFVVEQQTLLNSSIPRLRYDLNEETIAAVNRLKELGYIDQLKNNCLLYKMREDLITQLKSQEIKIL